VPKQSWGHKEIQRLKKVKHVIQNKNNEYDDDIQGQIVQTFGACHTIL
jgi:hypothetical protein